MYEIKLDGSEQKICRECIDDLRMGGKFEKSKMMQDSTVYRMDELEEGEEEVEGTVGFNGGEEVNYMPLVYPRGTVSVSSLGSFLSVGSSSKPSHPSLPLSLGSHNIQEYFKRKRGRKRKFIKPQQEKARQEERMKRVKVIVRAKLVVGYWELIPMESWDECSAPHDTSTVRVSEERQAEKKRGFNGGRRLTGQG